MDVTFELNGIGFAWDRDKARRNLTKHGVSFEQAAESFFDPFLRLIDAGPDEEARDAVVGMDMRWNLLFVVHIVVVEAQIRIISARKASYGERKYYES